LKIDKDPNRIIVVTLYYTKSVYIQSVESCKGLQNQINSIEK